MSDVGAQPAAVPFATRRRVIGVDFSAAEGAGKRIWISEGTDAAGVLRLDACYPAAALPGSGVARERCLPALRRFIAGRRDAVIGIETTFGVPRGFARAPNWTEFASMFEVNYPDPETFRAECRRQNAGREIKRTTDVEAQTPFAAYNLRLYRKTWYGIAELLAPLVLRSAVSVLPMQQPRPDRPWLLEACPPSSLKRADRYVAYKGSDLPSREARSALLDWLRRERRVELAPALSRVVIDDVGGDALDSVIVAEVAARALRQPDTLYPPRRPEHALEGFVFV